jgi:hypothetical protein
MESAEIPRKLLEAHPEITQIDEAMRAYDQGCPIMVTCPKGNEILQVIEVKAVGTLWVNCCNGCTRFRSKRATYR